MAIGREGRRGGRGAGVAATAERETAGAGNLSDTSGKKTRRKRRGTHTILPVYLLVRVFFYSSSIDIRICIIPCPLHICDVCRMKYVAKENKSRLISVLWTKFVMDLPRYSLCIYRSPSPSFEEDFGVSKDTLLHGSYADYIKEYSARSGRASGSGGSGQSSSHQPHQVALLDPPPPRTHTRSPSLSFRRRPCWPTLLQRTRRHSTSSRQSWHSRTPPK